MASTSATGNNLVYGRIKSASSTLFSDNQSLISEIRKSLIMIKDIAVDFERDNEHEMVKEFEAGVIQLLEASDRCTYLSMAIQSLSDEYQPRAEPTDFSKLFEDKVKRLAAGSSSVPQNNPLLRQFREAIWNVHHAGLPMPGEEQEDIVMTSTQCNLLNVTCPLSGKPVTELADPVRSMDCKHIYEKKVIMQYIWSKHSNSRCPVAGCPKKLQANRVVCDPLLLIEIEEMQSVNRESTRNDIIEDFTEVNEDA